MDWVHCNNCYIQPGDVQGKKFVITNCGHIYCTDCIQLPELKKCRVCQSSYITMPLSSKMSKEVEIYFRDPLEDFQKLVKILEFQQTHRLRLTCLNRERLGKYAALENEVTVLKEQLKGLQGENASLRERIKCLTTELQGCTQKLESFQTSKNQNLTSTDHFLHDGYSQQRKLTPKLSNSILGRGSAGAHKPVFRKTPDGSNVFLMSSSKCSNSLFCTPALSKISGPYRSNRTMASDESTPPTPSTMSRESTHKDPYQRKVKLPGDKGGPSPAVRSAFHRLTLSKLTSTPKKDALTSNKYSQYFNRT